MKRFTILAMFVVVTLGSFAQEVLQMHVWKNGDSRDYIVSTEIDSITFTKEIIYSPFFAWGVSGDVDWDVWDDNNPTEIYSGNIRTLLDNITDDITDVELSIGMTRYNASEHSYPGGKKLDKGTFLVILSDNMPNLSATPNGPNALIYDGDKKYFLMKEITRNGKTYGVYVFPDDKSAGSTWYDLKL